MDSKSRGINLLYYLVEPNRIKGYRKNYDEIQNEDDDVNQERITVQTSSSSVNMFVLIYIASNKLYPLFIT